MMDIRKGYIPELNNNDPNYQNIKGDTAGILLTKRGRIPPREWIHDINLKNDKKQSIKLLL